MLGQVEPPPVGLGAAFGREPDRELRQLGGRVGRSPHARLTRRGLDRLRHLLVRTVAGQGEVAGSLLRIGHRVRQRAMRLAPAAERRRRVDRRGEERMGELDPPVGADPHEPRLLGRERGPGRRRGPGPAAPARPPAGAPLRVLAGVDRTRFATSVLRSSGTGSVSDSRRPLVPSRSRAISSAYSGFPADACAMRTSVGRGNVRPSSRRRCDGARRATAGRARAAQALLASDVAQAASICLRPQGDDQRDGLVGQTPERELERRRRRRIEPLDVVDGDHDLAVGREHAQRARAGPCRRSRRSGGRVVSARSSATSSA